jgi:hypothetical protein
MQEPQKCKEDTSVAAATAVAVSIIGRRPVPFELKADALQRPTMTQNRHFAPGDDPV